MKRSVRRATPGLLLVLLPAFGLAGPAVAQNVPPVGGEDPVSAARDIARTHLEVGTRYTSLRSEGTLFVGGDARLDLGGPFTFGGGGWVQTEPLEIATGGPGAGLRLKMAYGGLLTGWKIVDAGRLRGDVRVLWGAGNAKLELPVVKTEIAADNFVVVEPAVSVALHLTGPLHLLGDVAWRWAGAVEDLPGVTAEHLRGLSASLGLALGPF